MYYNNNPYFSPATTISHPQKWDPEELFELTNPQKGKITCLGYAATRGRRCWNPCRADNVVFARTTLSMLSSEDAAQVAASSSARLEDVARVLLCHHHTGDRAQVVRQWTAKLERWAAPVKPEVQEISLSSVPTYGPQFSVKQEGCYADDYSYYYPDALYLRARQMQENIRRVGEQMRASNPTWVIRELERASQEAAQQQRQRREEEPERLKRVQQRKQEEERRRQEEEQQRRERERKEREAREAAFKERVRVRREREEREARERAEKTAREWREAWRRYSDAWDRADLTVEEIPWPVKSGLSTDVGEAGVRCFFRDAPPRETVGSAEDNFRLVSGENRRWHTDKVMQRFGPGVMDSDVKELLDVVAKTLVELRREAQKRRQEEKQTKTQSDS
ncbi:hypothetical protein F4778DRAFT_782517 [Xylariomycetidae sp. FL2044]|nr:hypothetical protein F4778DRAFT_782517 [Xylariomycetidae sp. FL2044]